MDFAAAHDAFRRRAEAAFDTWVPAPDTPPERLHGAMRYSLEAGGKRLRPVLVLAGHALHGGPADPEPAAVAVECLHTYSLIHDDLPAMDNSDLRRGRPTCHRQYDAATAILAGDALLTHAFALLAEAYADQPALAVALIRELGNAAGSRALIAGQADDTALAGQPITAAQLETIHRGKTAALLAACLAMGARLGGASAAQVDAARAAGTSLGLAFQIVDDILDATATTAQLGKDAGNDAANEKFTWVRLHGLAAARQRVAELTTETETHLHAAGGDPTFLLALIRQLEHRAM